MFPLAWLVPSANTGNDLDPSDRSKRQWSIFLVHVMFGEFLLLAEKDLWPCLKAFGVLRLLK